jgi:putative flippase GtrA
VYKNGWLVRVNEFLTLHKIKVRFLFAGALNTAIGLGVFPLLYFTLASYRLHYIVILCLSQMICILFAYITNKFLVFKTKGNYVAEFLKFITFHLSYFLVNLAALPILVEVVNINPVIAQLFFATMVIVSSYFWHSRITFISK